MRYPRLIYVLLFSLLYAGISAQINQSLVDADTLTVGARFKLIIKGDFPIKQVVVPDSIDGFTLIKQETIKKKGEQDYSSLTLSPLKPGSLSFPSLRVIPAGSADQEYKTDAFRLKVFAVRAQSDSLLRDIKPLKKYPFQKPWWLYPLLFVPILFWLVIALVKYFRRKPKVVALKESVKPVAPVLSAWEQALLDLSRLREMTLDTPEKIREYHYELALILRVFLERHYRIQAVEMTSYEIRDAMRDLHLPQTVESIRFLQYCDMVKFAKFFPDTAMITENSDWLEQYLAKHKPEVLPKPETEGEASDQTR